MIAIILPVSVPIAIWFCLRRSKVYFQNLWLQVGFVIFLLNRMQEEKGCVISVPVLQKVLWTSALSFGPLLFLCAQDKASLMEDERPKRKTRVIPSIPVKVTQARQPPAYLPADIRHKSKVQLGSPEPGPQNQNCPANAYTREQQERLLF